MNLLFVIVDSLRWDYAEKCGLFEAMEPASIFKCKVLGETTNISLPQILTGMRNPRNTPVGHRMTKNGSMRLTRIDEPTIFDYFKEAGYHTHYINIDREDTTHFGNKLSFFPNLPSGKDYMTTKIFEPSCIVLHYWDVHYPYPDGYEKHVRQFILERIPTLIYEEDTMIVLTADHGECLGENDRWYHTPPMVKELQEVPLIIYPAQEHRVHDTVVQSIHILPTILDMFGIKHDLKGSILDETRGDIFKIQP